MTDQRVISIEHHQSLTHGGGASWSEHFDISFRFLSGALSTGWLAKVDGNELKMLIALGLHARPLSGNDLALLVRLGFAGPKDAGRLFTYVTDKGLAAELNMDRKTIRALGQELKNKTMLDVWEIPLEGDSRSELTQAGYAGTKIYLLAGETNVFTKEVTPKGVPENPTPPSSENRGGGENFPTPISSGDQGGGEKLPTPMRKNSPGVGKNSPQILIHEEEEEDDHPRSNVLADPVLARFVQLKGGRHEFSEKELAARQKLAALGIPDDHILREMERAFRRQNKPRHFTLVANIAKETFESADTIAGEQPDSTPANRAESRTLAQGAAGTSNPESRAAAPEGWARPSAGTPDPEGRPESREPAGSPEPELPAPSELADAKQIIDSFNGNRTMPSLAQIAALALACNAAAQKTNSTGAAWVTRALRLSLQADNVARYLAATIDDWIEQGPPDLRPRRAKQPEAAAGRTNGDKQSGRWDDAYDN